MLGGAIADKFGRRRIVLFGLVFSALSAVAMGLVDNLAMRLPGFGLCLIEIGHLYNR
jgi:MFS family permease